MQNVGTLVGVVVAHILLCGCYQPELKDCTVQCAGANECTGGQVCKQGWCTMPDKSCDKREEEGLTPDGSLLTGDGTNGACTATSCPNGTCMDGVCVIDCTAAWSCPNDVTCAPGLPCRVLCGYHACGHKVLCGTASSCEVRCSGDYACADEIICNANRCDVDCVGSLSCKRRTKCAGSCACDVSCTGYGSCAEPSDCPSEACDTGSGCTDAVSGCNTCS